MSNTIDNRYEFVLLFDVENGNPNGDPDAGNMPRIDPETSHGIMTDVCLKRKVRNYVLMKNDNIPPNRIYILEKAVLNDFHQEAHDAVNSKLVLGEEVKKEKRKGKADEVEAARKWMCRNFFDVRTFGAVMSTGVNAGQVTGPVQINFSRSIDRITPMEMTITRMAVATEKEAEKQSGDNRTMGRKHIIPYGLYRAEGFISANLAKKTGFSEDDLDLFWESLINMFDHDHSASRGKVTARKLVVFKHDSAIGNAPAHVLLDSVEVEPIGDSTLPPRSFKDYTDRITIPTQKDMPDGVTVINKL